MRNASPTEIVVDQGTGRRLEELCSQMTDTCGLVEATLQLAIEEKSENCFEPLCSGDESSQDVFERMGCFSRRIKKPGEFGTICQGLHNGGARPSSAVI